MRRGTFVTRQTFKKGRSGGREDNPDLRGR